MMISYILLGLGILVLALGFALRHAPWSRVLLPTAVVMGIAAALLGAAGGVAAMYIFGYRWELKEVLPDVSLEEWERQVAAKSSGGVTEEKAEKKEEAEKKKQSPSSTRTLMTLLRKLDLLDRGISLTLEPEQAQQLAAELEGLEGAEALSEDNAKAKTDRILAVLTESQRDTLGSVELPSRSAAAGGAPAMGGSPGGGGNPFHAEAVAKQLQSFRARLTDRVAPK